MLTYILFAIGFILLIKGADYLVEGSSSIAKRLGVSDLVIGLTIVSFGTSAPELLVNVIASFKGAGDIVIGNVIGSNIANICLILGVSALIYPLAIKKETIWKGIPLNVLAAIVIIFVVNDVIIDGADASFLSRIDGLVLMCFFVIFVTYTITLAKSEKPDKDTRGTHSMLMASLMTIGGIFALIYGGKWVVEGAVMIARNFGLTEAMIGATIVAIGTSLPELVASAVAAYKRHPDIAIGNVVGSNLFNAFWVLGFSALISPIPFQNHLNIDVFVFFAATILLFLFAFTGHKKHVDKREGIILLICYISYIVFLVMRG